MTWRQFSLICKMKRTPSRGRRKLIFYVFIIIISHYQSTASSTSSISLYLILIYSILSYLQKLQVHFSAYTAFSYNFLFATLLLSLDICCQFYAKLPIQIHFLIALRIASAFACSCICVACITSLYVTLVNSKSSESMCNKLTGKVLVWHHPVAVSHLCCYSFT